MTIAAVVSRARSMFGSDEARPSSLLPQLRMQIAGARERYHQEIAQLVSTAASFKRPSDNVNWGDLSEIGSDDPQALAEFLASPAIQQHQVRFTGAPEYVEQWETQEIDGGARTEYRKIKVLAR